MFINGIAFAETTVVCAQFDEVTNITYYIDSITLTFTMFLFDDKRDLLWNMLNN